MRSETALHQLDYVKAPNGARLQASTIDAIFAAALSQFAAVLLGSFASGNYELLGSIVVTFAYYAYPLTVNGQTLGKKIYGLRVLPIDEDRALTLKEALMREVVGKTASYLFMCLGFFMILWRDDRRGLHDVLSKTTVVQDAAVAERKRNALLGFANSIAVSCILSTATLGYFYYSSFIADRLETQLTSQGVKVSDISGSLAKGFRISGLEITNDSGSINLGDVDLKLSNYSKLLSEHTLTISSLKVSNAEMKMQSGSGASLILGLFALPFIESKTNGEPVTEKKPPFQFKKIIVTSFSATGTKVIDPAKTLTVSLVQINQLEIDPKTTRTSWNEFTLQSSIADLQTGKLVFDNGDLILTSPIAAKVYDIPGVRLRQPIDLLATLQVSKGKLTNLQVNALKNTITITAVANKNYQIWVTSLSPGDYIDSLPFDKLSFYSSKASPFELVTQSPQSAVFEIGSAKFSYQPQAVAPANAQSIFSAMFGARVEAHYQAADGQYALKLPPGFLSTLLMGHAKVELSSSNNLAPEEILYRLGAKNPLSVAKFFVGPPRMPATERAQ